MEHHFGETVKGLRINAGLSQRELAARMDVHATQVGLWERAEKVPYKRTVKRFARAFNVTEDFLRGLYSWDCIVYPVLDTEDVKSTDEKQCPMCGYLIENQHLVRRQGKW